MPTSIPLPLLEQALAQVDDVVLITQAEPIDLPGPRIVFVNPAFERMTGYSADEVIGRTPRLLHGPRSDRSTLSQLRASLERWESRRVRMTNYRKNRIPFDVEFDVTPIADANGWYTHWVSIQRDITYESVAQRVISDAVTLEALQLGVCGELLEYMGATGIAWCTRLPGDRQWEIVTHGDIEVGDPETVEQAGGLIVHHKVTTGGLQMKFVAAPGPIPFDEFRAHIIVAVAERAAPAADRLHALRQRDRVENALRKAEKLEAIGRLAGGVAHDFNNLLTIVVGNVEYLQSLLPRSTDSGPVFSEILRATSRARDLVQHLLAFGRKRQLTRQPFEVGAALDAVESLLTRFSADVMSITTAVETPPPVVVGDPAMLEQVLLNIATNAHDAIAAMARRTPGELRIVASRVTLDHVFEDHMGTVLQAGRYVAIDVMDDGPGMSDEVRRRAIDPFFTTKPVGAGSGLGLSSAYGLVTMMGGTLVIDDGVPTGTVVRVILPSA